MGCFKICAFFKGGVLEQLSQNIALTLRSTLLFVLSFFFETILFIIS